MSSSFTYTLTNLWSAPSRSSRWSRNPACWVMRLSNSSPTVLPSPVTVAALPAAARMTVGRRTSCDTADTPGSTDEPSLITRPVRSGFRSEFDALLTDGAVGEEPGPDVGLAVAQTDDHVPPVGVDGLADVG